MPKVPYDTIILAFVMTALMVLLFYMNFGRNDMNLVFHDPGFILMMTFGTVLFIAMGMAILVTRIK